MPTNLIEINYVILFCFWNYEIAKTCELSSAPQANSFSFYIEFAFLSGGADARNYAGQLLL